MSLFDRKCPKCRQWIACIKTTPTNFDCPWCGAPTTMSDTGTSIVLEPRIIPHVERMIYHGMKFKHK